MGELDGCKICVYTMWCCDRRQQRWSSVTIEMCDDRMGVYRMGWCSNRRTAEVE